MGQIYANSTGNAIDCVLPGKSLTCNRFPSHCRYRGPKVTPEPSVERYLDCTRDWCLVSGEVYRINKREEALAIHRVILIPKSYANL